MGRRILVTGGAGFVGSHLVDALLARGHTVRVLDNLDPQVHGSTGRPNGHLNPDAEFHHADVRDLAAVRRAVAGVDVVFHLAAAVGVGQSMYRIRDYVASRLQAGTVWVNTYNVYDAAASFGGYKQSGFGREMGQHALDYYTQLKTVWVDLA